MCILKLVIATFFLKLKKNCIGRCHNTQHHNNKHNDNKHYEKGGTVYDLVLTLCDTVEPLC